MFTAELGMLERVSDHLRYPPRGSILVYLARTHTRHASHGERRTPHAARHTPHDTCHTHLACCYAGRCCNPGTRASRPFAKCDRGRFASRYGTTVCDRCPTGGTTKYKGATSSSKCIPDIGYYRVGTRWPQFKRCPAYMSTDSTGASSIKKCISDRGAFTTKSERDGHTVVHPCAKGTYSDEKAAPSCKDCPDYSTTVAAASPSRTSCVATAGFSGAAGGPFKPCGRGAYSNRVGMEVCADCDKAVETSGIGSAQCFCHAGHFKHFGVEAGGAEARSPGGCIPCKAGFYKEEHMSNKECTPCPAGKTSNVGTSQAADCYAKGMVGYMIKNHVKPYTKSVQQAIAVIVSNAVGNSLDNVSEVRQRHLNIWPCTCTCTCTLGPSDTPCSILSGSGGASVLSGSVAVGHVLAWVMSGSVAVGHVC